MLHEHHRDVGVISIRRSMIRTSYDAVEMVFFQLNKVISASLRVIVISECIVIGIRIKGRL